MQKTLCYQCNYMPSVTFSEGAIRTQVRPCIKYLHAVDQCKFIWSSREMDFYSVVLLACLLSNLCVTTFTFDFARVSVPIYFFFIQFYVPFKIISAHMGRTNQQVDENGRTPRKTTWHTRKQNMACLTCGQSGARTHTRHSGEMIE